jgi:hypothetical protein
LASRIFVTNQILGMAPKQKLRKCCKYDMDALSAMERGELVGLGREERAAGKIPADFKLSSKSELIVAALRKIKVTAPASGDAGAGALEDDDAGAATARADAGGVNVESPTERTKLEPPSALPTGPEKAAFRLWSQEVAIWRGTHHMHSDTALVSSILKALASAEKAMIFAAHNEQNPVTMKSLLSVLALPYAGSELAERQHKLSLFRACTRGSKSLSAFLGDWELKRGQCVMTGTVQSTAGEQEQWDLLKACELSTDQSASIMHELSTRAELRAEMGLPEATANETFELTKKLLRNLALSFELEKGTKSNSNSKEGGKWKEAELALFSKGKAKGKNKGAKGKGKGAGAGKGKEKKLACWTCGKIGHISTECWHAGKGTAKEGASDAKGKGKGKKGKGKSAGTGCFTCGGDHFARDCPKKVKSEEYASGDGGGPSKQL